MTDAGRKSTLRQSSMNLNERPFDHNLTLMDSIKLLSIFTCSFSVPVPAILMSFKTNSVFLAVKNFFFLASLLS
jgi:hypothetical protein